MREIDIHEFAAAHADGAEVIDVREPGEFVSGHVPGAAWCRMAQQGFDAVTVAGGTGAWIRSGRAVTTGARA